MALLDPIRSQAITKGVFGNSRTWLVIGAVVWGIRAISWARRPLESTIFREVIEPGQTLVIAATGPPPTKRDHRKSLKAERTLARRERREKLSVANARHRHRVL
jgi:hypothetical protein